MALIRRTHRSYSELKSKTTLTLSLRKKVFFRWLGWGECSRNLLHCIVLHEKSQKIFFVLALVAIYQEGLHVGPHATEVWGAWAVLLPLGRLLLEELVTSGDTLKDLGLHLGHLLLHLGHHPPPLLVDHQQLLQLPLCQLLLQLPVLATPPRRLVVEVSHPAELLSGRLGLAQVGRGTLRRRVRCDRPACWGQRWPATFPTTVAFRIRILH